MKNRFYAVVVLFVLISAFCTILTSCGNKTESSSKTVDVPVAGYEASLIDFGTDGYSFVRKNGTEAKIASGAKVILKKIHEDNVEVSAESTDGDMVDGLIDVSRISWREDALDLFLPYYVKGYRSAEEVFQDVNLSNHKKNQELIYKLLVSFKELWPEWENYKNQDADSLPENISKILDDILYKGDFYDKESQTAIHFFAENAGADFMKRFVLSRYNYSSNVDFKDQNGRTPLMTAVLAGNASAMQMLLMNDADMEMKDYSGKSARDYVRESSSREVKAVAEAKLTAPEDFYSLISALKEKQVAACLNNGVYLKIPLSLWQRYEKTGRKISVKSDIREFYTELSLLEASNDGEKKQTEQNQNELDQNDGHKQTAYTFSDDMKSPVMNDRASNSQVMFELNNGTEVQILERSEGIDTLNDVTDWWYKIKSGEQEGWCFGGNLFHPYCPEDVESLEKERDILEQQDFEKNKIYKAFCNGEIICKDGKKVPVKTGNNISVLSAVEDCMDYSSSSLGKCRYYIVQGPEFDVGILSGACIAHKEIKGDQGGCDGKTKWFFSLYSDAGNDCYADVSMVDYATGKDMHMRFHQNARVIGENSLVGDRAKLKLSGAEDNDYDEKSSVPDSIQVHDWRKIETPPEWNQELGKDGDYYILVINGHAQARAYFSSYDDRSVNYFSAWCVTENGWANEIISERSVEWSVSGTFQSYGMRVEEFPASDEKLNNTICEFVVSTYDYGKVIDDWDGLPAEYTEKKSYRYDPTVPCTYELSDTEYWKYIPEW